MSEAKEKPKLFKYLALSAAIGFTALACWALIDLVTQLQPDQLSQALHSIANLKVALAALATVMSFATMAVMEWLAARHYVRPDFPLRQASFFSFMVYGISNTFGFAGLASTPLRLRLYDAEGGKTDRILSFCLLATTAFWIGLFLLMGVSLVGTAATVSSPLPLPPLAVAAIGFTLIGVCLGACRWLSGKSKKVIGGFDLSFPAFRQLLAQSALAALDWFFAGVALYALLPQATDIPVFRFLAGFLLSQVAALVSSIPGGIGVLEGFSLYMMDTPKAQMPALAAAFIAYRSIYYLPPLVMAFLLFAVWNLKRAKGGVAQAGNALITYGQSATPLISALLAAFIGFSLLITSGQAFELVSHFSILPAFWESLFGTALLILAIGLYERSSSARKIAMVMMAALFASALILGPVWSAAGLTATLAALLYFQKREFYRQSELSVFKDQLRFSAVVVLPTLTSMILAIVSYYRHELDSQQWWKFAFDATASGFLRGCVGSLIALGSFGLWSLLSPRRRPVSHLTPEAQAQDQHDFGAIKSSPYTTACLALIGDKDLFRTEGITGFIMYKVAKPYWIAMGDPVCAPQDAKPLMAAFLAECDRLGASPVLYQTRPETLSRYVEVGFQAVKIGEEARVKLPDFSLEGRERKGMRNTCSRIERDGYKFALLARDTVPANLPELRRVSNEWLEKLSMREKGFSVGFFSDSYIAQNDVAVIVKEDRIVAFANLWLTGVREEYSVDLMRYSADAPSGVMEYLIIQLMLRAKSEGYAWFNLGMAPLAGLEGIHSGRQWHKVGTVIYRAGEAFYNFRGLKSFKDKFGPEWESRFLVYPPGSNLARVLSSVALLINFRSRRIKNAATSQTPLSPPSPEIAVEPSEKKAS